MSTDKIKLVEQYYKDYFKILTLSSFTLTKDIQASQDLVQDFFLYYYGKEDLVIHGDFISYATKAVKNLSLQYLDKKRLQLAKRSDDIMFLDHLEEEPTLIYQNKVRRLSNLMNALPESRRGILMASVVEGLSYSEIADENDISINTVKTQIKRAYSFIRKNSDTVVSVLISFYFGT